MLLALLIGLTFGAILGAFAVCLFASECPECRHRAEQEARLYERVMAGIREEGA